MTTSAVVLADLKAHLRVDHDFEDELISGYALAATEYAEHLIGREIVKENDQLAVCTAVGSVPQAIRAWIFCYVDDLYRQRGLIASGPTAIRTYDHLLDRFTLYHREES